MKNRFVMEIVGLVTALCTDDQGPASSLWANTYLPVIAEIPSGTVLSAGKLDSEIDYGGFTVKVTDVSALMEDLTVDTLAVTTLAETLNRTATTVKLASTAGFPAAPSVVRLGTEFILYTGISGNDLTGCVRAIRGSYPQVHLEGKSAVPNYNYLVGRDVHCYWENRVTGQKWTRFVGTIDSVFWERGYYSISLVSRTRALQDSEALYRPYLKGVAIPTETALIFPPNPVTRTAYAANIEVFETSASDANSYFTQGRKWVALKGDKFSVRLASETWDSTGSTRAVTVGADPSVVILVASRHTVPASFSKPLVGSISVPSVPSTHTGFVTGRSDSSLFISGFFTTPPSALGLLSFPNMIFFPRVTDGFVSEEEVSEVRVLEGGFIREILLPLLVSTGTGNNSAYDVLPEGWGLGLPAKTSTLTGVIDIASFEAVASRVGHRRYVFTDTVDVFQLAKEALRIAGAFLYVSETGIVEARTLRDIQPNTPVVRTITNANMIHDEPPVIDFTSASLFTEVSVKGQFGSWDNPGTENVTIAFELERTLYGSKIFRSGDEGIYTPTLVPSTIFGFLLNYNRPYGRIKVTVPVVFAEKLEVGQVVQINLSHLPNAQSSTGFNLKTLIEAISYSDGDGQVELTLLARTPLRDVGLIAPSGIVNTEDDDVIQLRLASVSEYAPEAEYPNTNPPHNGTGIQDSDWFQVGDGVVIFRASTFGDATPDTHSTRITAINYTDRELTLHTTPAWSMVGAVVRFDSPAYWENTTKRTERAVFYVTLDPSAVTGIGSRVWSL